MNTPLDTLHEIRLGGFGQSQDLDAETAGREAVRAAFACRVPAEGDLVVIFPSGEFARVTGSTGVHNSSVALLVL